jgi:hypothetical protein
MEKIPEGDPLKSLAGLGRGGSEHTVNTSPWVPPSRTQPLDMTLN